MSANSQYIPLKNEYILHTRLNIYCIGLRIYTASANAVLLRFQLSQIN
ncbi:unknown [Bacteroides sp. CAG:702]|nr:unknown [Bacteroides sp. CAG:702]